MKELSMDEVEQVNGGIAPLVVAAWAAGGFVAGAAAGYWAQRD